MSETGGRIGGYCNPAWATAAKRRESFESCIGAIATTVKDGGISASNIEWELTKISRCSITRRDTGLLKQSRHESQKIEVQLIPPTSAKLVFTKDDMIKMYF